jgi:outer membrane murein-binding lipoprotein Lpp
MGWVTVDLLSAVVAVWALAGCLFLWREMARLKAKLWEATAAAETWQRKFEQLAQDVRKKASEPVPIYKVGKTVTSGPRKLRSSAEVRRVFEEINGRE